jgi:hypothetical protein
MTSSSIVIVLRALIDGSFSGCDAGGSFVRGAFSSTAKLLLQGLACHGRRSSYSIKLSQIGTTSQRIVDGKLRLSEGKSTRI